MKISNADRKRLDRIRKGDPLELRSTRSLERRGIIGRLPITPYETTEYNRITSRRYYFEILKPEEVK